MNTRGEKIQLMVNLDIPTHTPNLLSLSLSMKITFTSLFVLIIQIASAQDSFLVVSSGGGVTGSATVYKIGLDGKVLKGKGLGQVKYAEQGQLKKSIAKRCYRKAKTAVGASPDFNHPGNLYYSIATLDNGKESKITWGDLDHPAPEKAKDLYQEITKILSALPFTANPTK